MKSAMSAQPISFSSRVRSHINIYRVYRKQLFAQDKAQSILDYHNNLASFFTEQTALPIEGTRMLEVGCGQLAHQTALFSRRGANVTGIDIEIPTYQLSLETIFKTAQKNGIERAAKSLLRAILFDKQTKKAVSDTFGQHVSYKNLDTRIMDACKMTFNDRTFDFIFSKAVFEHIEDVPAAAAETNRVLSDHGVAVIYLHLYPCLSGGHNFEWSNPDVDRKRLPEPWDHLLEHKYPANTYLNKLRINDYRSIFHKYMEVIKEVTITEGDKHLTEERFKKLQALGYTREDLLTRTIGFYVKRGTGIA